MTTTRPTSESFPQSLEDNERRGPIGHAQFISSPDGHVSGAWETSVADTSYVYDDAEPVDFSYDTFPQAELALPSSLSKEQITSTFISHNLHEEIVEAQAAGLDVSIGDTYDSVYEQPERVVAMYDKLSVLGKEFTRRKSSLSAPKAGRTALGLPLPQRASTKAARREYEATLEEARDELLYEAVQGQPWHQQRGCATALLTITGAHELAVKGTEEGSEKHPTMSAALDSSILDYTFEGNSLNGLSLRDGLIAAGQRFRGKSAEAAAAFTDVQLRKLGDFLEAPVTREFKDIVEYCTDSLGIRSRKEEVAKEIDRYASERIERDPANKQMLMISIGCGTALPMLEVAASMKEKGLTPRLILLDQDPIALASAVQFADRMGLSDYVEIHCERLFSKTGRPLDLNTVLKGRKLDVAEDSGLREYLPDRIYTALTRQIWGSLEDGGLMTTGNMNSNRPQAEFLHGLMGWTPAVQMRTIQEGIRLHRQAGVPTDATRMRVTQDGVYTMYFSTKSAKSTS